MSSADYWLRAAKRRNASPGGIVEEDDAEVEHFNAIHEANTNLPSSDNVRTLEIHQTTLLELHGLLANKHELEKLFQDELTNADTCSGLIRKILLMIEAGPGQVETADKFPQVVTLGDVVPAAALQIFTPIWKKHLTESDIPLHEFKEGDLLDWEESALLSEFMTGASPGSAEEAGEILLGIHNELVQWHVDRAFKSGEEMTEADTILYLQSVLRMVEYDPAVFAKNNPQDMLRIGDVFSKIVPFFNQAWRAYKREWTGTDLLDWHSNDALRSFMNDTAALCCICHEPELEGSMLTCSAPMCTDRFHFVCHKSEIQEMPQVPVPEFFCPKHEHMERPTHDDAHRPENRSDGQRPRSSARPDDPRPNPLNRLGQPADPLARPQHILIENGNFSTCYADSAMQVFFRLPRFSGSIPPNLADKDAWIAQKSAEHMAAIKALSLEMQELSAFIFSAAPGSRVGVQKLRKFFSRVNKVDPSYTNARSDESSGFFDLLVETVVAATDTSTNPGPGRRNAVDAFRDQQDKMEKEGTILSAHDTAVQRSLAWTASGRESPFHALFNTSLIMERQCGEDGCPGISRAFAESNFVRLPFPEAATNDDTVQLTDMLAAMVREEDGGAECPMDKSHTNGKHRVVRIAYAPTFFTVAFNRRGYQGFETVADRMCGVDLPDELDLAPYSDQVRLPSDARFNDIPGPDKLPYRIRAVIMYRNVHYIAFFLIEGEWVCFDGVDRRRYAFARDPRAAGKEGYVASQVVYERQNARDEPSPMRTFTPSGADAGNQQQGVPTQQRHGAEKQTTITTVSGDQEHNTAAPDDAGEQQDADDVLPDAPASDSNETEAMQQLQEREKLLAEQRQQFGEQQEEAMKRIRDGEKLLAEQQQQFEGNRKAASELISTEGSQLADKIQAQVDDQRRLNEQKQAQAKEGNRLKEQNQAQVKEQKRLDEQKRAQTTEQARLKAQARAQKKRAKELQKLELQCEQRLNQNMLEKITERNREIARELEDNEEDEDDDDDSEAEDGKEDDPNAF
ncbi:hypothetical protein TI39_contig256g00004 [Zymoseptoria brevis]|uniref:USP domain-containing protein n=1 Tax=Zymoseptoria brevis TaxID=1047168 RepID=A0A0F4GY02_9PEZI|nr:hypothetical protein TI39_contig256g00004 [Zymoseptoria brevis]